MAESLNAHQLIQLAQCLTRMQSAVTDYELHHYTELTGIQKNKIEISLSQLAAAAGRIYAYSVQLEFREAAAQLQQIKEATEELKKFLKTAQTIQQVLDIVGSVASLADSIISHDIGGITAGINQVIQMLANN
jgi:hypothetical protein